MSQPGLVVIVGLCIINGIFSPHLLAVYALQGIWYPFFLPPSAPLVFLASSLILSTLTLMIAGIPAAISERLLPGTSRIPELIWLVAVALMTLPALPNVLRALGLAV